MEGRIVVFTGPMSSGKTTALLNTIERYMIREIPTVVFKPKFDTRYGEDSVCTHDKKYNHKCINVQNAKQILQHVQDIQVVGIDEAMMLDSELVQVCQYLRASGRKVYISTLDMDYKMEPFLFSDGKSNIGGLLAIANRVVKFQAVCTQRNHKGLVNGTDAHFTKRTSSSVNLLEVGGLESYTPVSLKFHPRLDFYKNLYY